MTSSSGPRPLRLLFYLRSANLDRLYAALLETLLARGHETFVVVERERDTSGGGGAVLADLARAYPSLSVEQLVKPHDRWRRPRRAVRLGFDYLRYFEPEFRAAPALRLRARRRTPPAVRVLLWPWARFAPGRALARAVLAQVEHRIPLGPSIRAEVGCRRPDVVLVSPLVSLGSPQSNWIRAAAELGIPSVLPVASWDNLTNKGVVKQAPALTIVWNEAQAEEAVRFHRIPRERVVVSGAHSFDQWFGRLPSTSRATFLEVSGLPGRGPFLLYVCSSTFVAQDERPFVREWLSRLRGSENASLRDVNVVVRPHPLNARDWADFDLRDPRSVVRPLSGELPTDEQRRELFFDSIYHAAGIVGVSTSAFIEAAIVGRPAFTLVSDRFGETQTGTLHFEHVAGADDGVLVIARSWPEHLGQLADELEQPGAHADRIEAFVRRFVRPLGIDRPAARAAADAIEAVAGRASAARAAHEPVRA